MTEIIKVDPTEEIFSVTWELTSYCNYSCSYCPPELHNKINKFHSLTTLKNAWLNVLSQARQTGHPIKVTFTGGEITTVRHFLPFVQWMRDNSDSIHSILVITNGSASTKLYTKLSEYVDAITFSTHSEFFNEDKFFESALALNQKMVRPKKSFHVNIMNESWNQTRIEKYKQLLNEHQISYSVNEINYNGLANPASTIIEKNNSISFVNHPNYNCRVTLDTGEEVFLHANTLHNEKVDFWRGWTCEAGHTRIHIDSSLNVYSGVCRNDFLGSATNFRLLPPTICKRIRCTGCTDDLIIRKYK